MAKEKTFVNGAYFKKKVFDGGGYIIEMDIELEEFVKFANQYAVGGRLNLTIQSTRAGDKMYGQINDWKRDYALQQQAENQAPQQSQPQYQQPQQTPSQPAYQAPVGNQHQPTPQQVADLPNYDDDDIDDDVPF